MKIGIMSDLHVEHDRAMKINLAYSGDVLVVAGDLNAYTHMIPDHIREFQKNYTHVVMVAGNHEFYGNVVEDTIDQLIEYYEDIENFHFLDAEHNPNEMIDDVLFTGDILWSDVTRDPRKALMLEFMLNDYRKIYVKDSDPVIGTRRLKTEDVSKWHEFALNEIKYQLSNDYVNRGESAKRIVVTHHAPSRYSLSGYANHDGDIGYYTDLGAMLHEVTAPQVWIHGHIHDPSYMSDGTEAVRDYQLGNTRVIANPFGYPGTYNPGRHETLIEV